MKTLLLLTILLTAIGGVVASFLMGDLLFALSFLLTLINTVVFLIDNSERGRD